MKTQKFFLITSKEDQDSKLREMQQKEDIQAAKKARQEARAKKVQDSVKLKNEQAKKKAEKETKKAQSASRAKNKVCKRRQNGHSKKQKSDEVDTTPCGTCSQLYCNDDTIQPWIKC